MIIWIFAVALLAFSSAVITENPAGTAAAPTADPDWEAVAAAMEQPPVLSAGLTVFEIRRRDTGVIVRPLSPPDRNGRTVMLDPLPPHSIIGKGAGLILEKAPPRGRP